MKRVLIGGILHETNTFNPRKTDIENFRTKELFYGDEIISKRRNTNSETGGFIKGLESAGIEILPSILASAIPSGIVTKRAVDTFTDTIIDYLEKNCVDGILLSLHGAMVFEEYIDGEGYILEKIRSKTGFDIPVTVTLDLHAVLTEKIAKYADAIVIYRTYPHIDMAERGFECANIMKGILEKKFRPVVEISKQPLLIGPPLNVLPVDFPMKLIMDRARQIEKDTPGVIGVCPAHGFMQQDVDFTGTGVAVTTDNDKDLAKKIADELGNMIFGYRHDFFVRLPDPAETIKSAKECINPPVAIADSGDNIGAGTPGDGTVLLHEILKQNVDSAFIQIWDTAAALKAAEAGIGATVKLTVGGKSDPVFGPPVEIKGIVRTLSDGVYLNREWGGYSAGIIDNMGLSARIDMGGITIVVTSVAVSPNNRMHANSIGVYPEDYRMTVCKGGLAFREAYKPPVSNTFIQSDTPGYSSPNLKNFDFKKIKRPIYPLDDI